MNEFTNILLLSFPGWSSNIDGRFGRNIVLDGFCDERQVLRGERLQAEALDLLPPLQLAQLVHVILNTVTFWHYTERNIKWYFKRD